MNPDCYVVIDGTRFADTAAELASTPVALAEVDLSWGRGNTVDQPPPATCRVAILDRPGGTAFTDVLDVGLPLELHATGDVAKGTPVDVAQDGSFEQLALGSPGLRAVPAPSSKATLTVVDQPASNGIRALRHTTTSFAVPDNYVRIPPAAFTPGNPAGWDQIPRLGPNPWSWRLSVFGARHSTVNVAGAAFPNPQDTAAAAGLVGTYRKVRGDGAWHELSNTVAANATQVDAWLGVTVTVQPASWLYPGPGELPNPTTTWTQMPVAWADYGPTYLDELELWAPAGGTVRDALVFAGRITDLQARVVDGDGTVRVEVTAVDQLADLENRFVGDEPWIAEPLAARVNRIVAASGAGVTVRIDDPLGTFQVSWRDVDNQGAGALLAELAASVDGVLWSATHATTGPYLWFENMTHRAQVGVLELVDGIVTIVVDSGRAPGRTVLDGCQIPTEALTWIRDVTDVVTRVDLTWLEQLTTEGLPTPTERNVRVLDAAAEQTYGVRRMGVTTQLTSSANAVDVGDRILARTRQPQGRIDGLTWDLGLFEQPAGEPTAAALDLLDGTIRVGRGVIVEQAALWPGGETIGVYLDGGRYTFDELGWTLGLVGTPLAGIGESAEWNDLDPTWTWLQIDPTLEWPDLYGVAGPLAREGMNDYGNN